jgi:hypothetical protein
VFALALLLSAAVDLSLPACCVDDEGLTLGCTTLGSTTHDGRAGHAGDDCFCCSRTVRTEPVLLMSFVATESPIAPSSAQAPADVPARPSYHPPQV